MVAGRRSGPRLRRVDAVLYVVVVALVPLWVAFWVIRLAVRYGMNDALKMNREWLRAGQERDVSPK
jgi:hypothetical protein